MFVIRGESHTMPGGYLARQLDVVPMIVMSVWLPSFATLGETLDVIGRTWRLGEEGNLFYWGVENPMPYSKTLLAWLKAE